MYAISQNSYNFADWLCKRSGWLGLTDVPREMKSPSSISQSHMAVAPDSFLHGILLSLSGLALQPVSWSQSKKLPKVFFWLGMFSGFGIATISIPLKIAIGTSRSVGLFSSIVASLLRNEETFGDDMGKSSTRVRPPRFFENKDEKLTQGGDLLVEYVKGENVGLALLSRVKMGSYLSNGYMWHAENVYAEPPPVQLRKISSYDNSIWLERRKSLVRLLCGTPLLNFGKLSQKKEICPMTLLFTKREILMLSGTDVFCVEWELPFEEIISLELEHTDAAAAAAAAVEGTSTFLCMHHVTCPMKPHYDPDFDEYALNHAFPGLSSIQGKTVYFKSFMEACAVVRQILHILPHLKQDASLNFLADDVPMCNQKG
uniref:Uncharacterized protein n=1 Tax=Corethron hystrix TaxID=216773 RepID=A0A7S1BCV6_9STRA